LTVVEGPSTDPAAKLKARYDDRGVEHGPGMHVTMGVVSRFRFENVCTPEHPLKVYPILMAVTF
jgi:hypothetical protein